MLLKGDASQLEWRVKVFLAQDKVAMEEISNKLDVHTKNQNDFVLPTRTVAKNFLFRMIYADAFGDQGMRGPAFAYVHDPKFNHVSKKLDFWAEVVERFFNKYQGVYQHSRELIREGCETGRIVSPSGRVYPYHTYTKWDGTPEWPRAQMLNYIVQGFGTGDLMTLARQHAYENWNYDWGVLINTVHDDIEADVKNDPGTIYAASCLMEESFRQMNPLCFKWYGVELNVPMEGEVKWGMNLHEESMVKFKRETLEKDFETYVENYKNQRNSGTAGSVHQDR